VAAAVLNGVRPARFADGEAEALGRVAESAAGPVGEGARSALEHLGHQRDDAEHRARRAEGCGVPVTDLPRLVRRRMDLAAVEELAGHLGAPA
jgi:hypothetical protein